MRQFDQSEPAGSFEPIVLYIVLLWGKSVRARRVLLSKPWLRNVDVAIVLHLREHRRADAREVLGGLITAEAGRVAAAEVIHDHRLAAHRLLAGRRLREHVPLGHAGRLGFEPRALTGRTTTVYVEYRTLTLRAPVATSDPRRTVTQFTRRDKGPRSAYRIRSDKTWGSSEFS